MHRKDLQRRHAGKNAVNKYGFWKVMGIYLLKCASGYSDFVNIMPVKKDLYAVLGLSSTATPDEIKKAFRLKASEFHPDKNTSELAPLKFREVREAYEVLSDPLARTAYDENRRRNLLESPVETAHEIWLAYLSGVLS